MPMSTKMTMAACSQIQVGDIYLLSLWLMAAIVVLIFRETSAVAFASSS
jgi:hypothetical protein